MFNMLAQLWKALTVGCMAIERLFNGLNNLAEVAEIHSKILVDEARLVEAKGLAAAKKELAAVK